MTAAVAEAIGGLMGTIRKVNTSRSHDYIGRFLRVKIHFNVKLSCVGRLWISRMKERFGWILNMSLYLNIA